MADFTIEKPVPFVVEGVDGKEYELPRFNDMNADQVEAMAPISNSSNFAEKVREVKSFILALCPELEDEPLADMGYMHLFNKLSEKSAISMGES